MGESFADGVPVPSATLDAVPGLVYHLDFDGRLRWWNDRFALATGYTDEELDGLDVRELLVEADHDRARAARAAVRDGGEWRGILRLQTKDGETLTHRHDIAVVDSADRPEGVTGVARDPEGDAETTRADMYRRMTEMVGDTVDVLVTARTGPDIERALCEGLCDSGLYSGAWVGHLGSGGAFEVTTAIGATTTGLDSVAEEWGDADRTRPAAVAAETGEIRVYRDIPNSDLPASVRDLAIERGVLSAATVPIPSSGGRPSVLSLHTDRQDAFDDLELLALEQLCRVVGIVADAVRTERLAISDPSVELEFRQTDPAVPLVSLALEEGVDARLEQVRHDDDGNIIEQLVIEGASPETVVQRWEAADNVLACRLVDEAASLYEVAFDRSAAGTLLDAGAEIQDAWTVDGSVHFTATVPSGTDVRTVVERIRDIYPETQLVAKRTLGDAEGSAALEGEDGVGLTDRQLDVLAAAAKAGYFEWPRDATAEEVAEVLDISAATLHYHLRRAEQALVDSFLDGQR